MKKIFTLLFLLVGLYCSAQNLQPVRKNSKGVAFTKVEVLYDYKSEKKLRDFEVALREIKKQRKISKHPEPYTVNQLYWILENCTSVGKTRFKKGEQCMGGINSDGNISFGLDRPSYSNYLRKIEGDESVLFLDLKKVFALDKEDYPGQLDPVAIMSLWCENPFYPNVGQEKVKVLPTPNIPASTPISVQNSVAQNEDGDETEIEYQAQTPVIRTDTVYVYTKEIVYKEKEKEPEFRRAYYPVRTYENLCYPSYRNGDRRYLPGHCPPSSCYGGHNGLHFSARVK